MKHELVIGKYTLESLTNGMYSSPLDMYREYIQNAVDSFDEAIETGLAHPDNLFIDINIDSDSRKISIRDNGCGIRSTDAVGTLLNIGNSSKKRITARGFRGIGRLAGLSYCEKLAFRTSFADEDIATIIEFDAAYLKDLLLPGSYSSVSVEDVFDKIVSIHTEKEKPNRRYFQVELFGVEDEGGLTDQERVQEYLSQHAPLRFSMDFKWGRTITEKMRLIGFQIPQYRIRLNEKDLFKTYRDTFISDRVKKNTDFIRDVKVEAFYSKNKLAAVLWYAETSFYGTIIDNTIKGIRVRQGNILVGDKASCNSYFKEERFNGWIIGELHIVDPELIVNSRRDDFEKNHAYYELVSNLKDWAFEISKEIRRLSYKRSLSTQREVVASADFLEDIADENSLYSEDLAYAEDFGESQSLDLDESTELAEADYISKLELFITQKKAQTKYTALNINSKLTVEQRKVLERVFDLISQEYDHSTAEQFVTLIAKKF